jgi:UDP-N-acetyl-D-galactosamine dehydrogenase
MKFEVCVIGLGYVGLPLAVAISKKYNCTGFDVNEKRINELKSCIDSTREIETQELAETTLNPELSLEI